MPSLEQLYAAVVIGLLLAALGASIPVLKGIYRDARERQPRTRKHEPGTQDHDADTAVSDPTAVETVTADGTRVVCRRCGVANDPSFTYCRRCVAPL